jgi:hypothetical protein
MKFTLTLNRYGQLFIRGVPTKESIAVAQGLALLAQYFFDLNGN